MKERSWTINKVGIVVATKAEKLPFIEVFGKPSEVCSGAAYDVLIWKNLHHYEIYLIESSYGEIAAAAATQYLIDKFNVERIFNYGAVGGLHEEHPVHKVGVASKIVHYDFDLSADGEYPEYPVGRYPNQKGLFIMPAEEALPSIHKNRLPEFICASADKFVGAGEPKKKLRRDFNADICEMEAAAIVITCNRNGIPCSFIKAISDGVDEGGKAFDQNVAKAARACVEELARFLT